MSVPQANYNWSSRLVFWFELWSRAGYVDCSRVNVFNIINISRSYTVFQVSEIFLWFVFDVYIGVKILLKKFIRSES